MVELRIVGNPDHDLVTALVAVGYDFHRVLEQDRVGNDAQFPRQLADMRFAQGDMLDLAGDVLAFDDIANAHFLAHHDEHAGKEILEDVLECEPDRHRANPEPGEQAGEGQVGHHHDRGDEQADDPYSELDQRVD